MCGRTIAFVGVLLAGGVAAAQINIGQRLPDGQQVGMGNIREDPAGEKVRMQEAYRNYVKLAREGLSQQRWGEAREAAERANALVTEASQVAEIRDLYMELETQGRLLLKQADEAYNQQRYAGALRTYRRIDVQFGMLPCGKDARAAVKRAASDPEAQSALQEDKAAAVEEMVEKIVAGHFAAGLKAASAKAPSATSKKSAIPTSLPSTLPSERADRIKLLDPPELARAVRLLESIVKSYPQTIVGQRAAADLDKLRSDKRLSSALKEYRAEREPEKAFNKAESYRKAGLKAKAVELYQQVIDKYPDSPEAAKAQVMIIEINPQSPVSSNPG